MAPVVAAEVRTADLLGTTIRYRQLGRVDDGRPVLLLLHGIGDSSATWAPVIEQLAARPPRRRPGVVAVDMLGHGGSSKPRTDYSLGAHANVLRDLMGLLGVRRTVVVGHSLGGGIAMQLLYQYPDLVEGMVLESPGGLGPDVFPLLRAATLPGAGAVIRLLSATLGLPVLGPAGTAALKVVDVARIPLPRDVAEVMRIVRPLVDVDARAAFISTLRSVVDPAGQRVSALSKLMLAGDRPVTLVWGDRDPIIPVAHGRDATHLLPQTRFEVFAGAGHFPHADDPARYADLLVDAVREVQLRGGGRSVGSTGRAPSKVSARRPSTPRSSRADTVTDTP